jgi:hypothetical protein
MGRGRDDVVCSFHSCYSGKGSLLCGIAVGPGCRLLNQYPGFLANQIILLFFHFCGRCVDMGRQGMGVPFPIFLSLHLIISLHLSPSNTTVQTA